MHRYLVVDASSARLMSQQDTYLEAFGALMMFSHHAYREDEGAILELRDFDTTREKIVTLIRVEVMKP